MSSGWKCAYRSFSNARKKDTHVAKLADVAAARGAKPRNFNHFKATLMQNLVMRAIRDA